jgi:hypothetical protein
MDSGPLHLASCTDAHIIQLGSAINPAFKDFIEMVIGITNTIF